MRQGKQMTLEHFSKKDNELCKPIFWYTILSVYCTFGRSFGVLTYIPDLYFNILRYGISLLFLLKAFRYTTKKSRVILFILEVLFGVSYLISISSGNLSNESALTYIVTTLIICVPFCALLYSMNDFECLYTWLKRASYVNVVLLIVYLVGLESTTYSMAASYSLLFCLTILFNELFRKGSRIPLINVAIIIVGIALIFIHGARGPLLCFVAYVALKVITEVRENKRAFFGVLLGSIVLFVAVINYDIILKTIGNILDKSRLYSRTYQLILANNLFNDSGRSAFHEIAIELIWKNPLLGYGAGSDVILLGGQYTHSMFLEIMFDFGIVIGFCIFALVSIEMLRAVFMKKSVRKELMVIFIILGYFMLFFSSTYLQSTYLFMAMGIMLREPVVRKYKVLISKKAGVNL